MSTYLLGYYIYLGIRRHDEATSRVRNEEKVYGA